MKRKKQVVVSGGFDPIHKGHVRLIKEARALGDSLVVVLNNNNWLMKKKGFVFQDELERAEILEELESVDSVMISLHNKDCEDMSVCKELNKIRPDIFANGGDRKSNNIPEYQLCESLGIEMVFNIGGEKIQSSSELTKKVKG